MKQNDLVQLRRDTFPNVDGKLVFFQFVCDPGRNQFIPVIWTNYQTHMPYLLPRSQSFTSAVANRWSTDHPRKVGNRCFTSYVTCLSTNPSRSLGLPPPVQSHLWLFPRLPLHSASTSSYCTLRKDYLFHCAKFCFA